MSTAVGLEETWDFIFGGQGQRATLAKNVVSLEDLLSVADNQLHWALVGLGGLGRHREELITATFPVVSSTTAATDSRVG